MGLQIKLQPGPVKRSMRKGMTVPSRGYRTRNPRAHFPYSGAEFQPTQDSRIHRETVKRNALRPPFG